MLEVPSMTTISASSTIGLFLSSPSYANPVYIVAGVTVSNSSGAGVSATSGVWTIQNGGSIAGSATSAFGAGVVLPAGGSVTNQSGATISGFAGIEGDSAAVTVVNAGSIAASTISVPTGNGAVDAGIGVFLDQGGDVTNQSSGIISGYHGIYDFYGTALTVVNAGRIVGGTTAGNGMKLDDVTADVTNQSHATMSGDIGIADYRAALTVVNYGSIAGNATAASGRGLVLFEGGSVTNQSGATISGYTGIFGGSFTGTSAASAALTVVNAGNIAGTGTNGIGVDLSVGGTLTNAGTITGSGGTAVVFGSTVNNLLVLDPGYGFSGLAVGGISASNTLELASAASAGTISGLGTEFINFGSIVIDAGADWTIAGNTSGLAGTISGFAAGDTIEVTGVTATGSSYIGGVLTLSTGGGPVTLDLPGTFTASSFMVTNVAGGADVSLASTTIDAKGTLTGTYTSSVTLTSASYLNPVTVSATGLLLGGTGDGLDSLTGPAWTVVNQGRIAATGTNELGVYLRSGGSVTNAASASISGGFMGIKVSGGAGTVVNDGNIAGTGTYAKVGFAVAGGVGIYLRSGGLVTNATSASIIGVYDGISMVGNGESVVNYGRIAGTGTHAAGVYLNTGGSVTNAASASITGIGAVGITGGAGTVVNDGTISGGGTSAAFPSYGVALHAGGSVTNATSAAITGGYHGVEINGGVGNVVNYGSIAATGTGTVADGVFLLSGGSVTNAASASITGGSHGVEINGGVGNVVNDGSIAATGTSTGTVADGVFLDFGGSVTNAASASITGYLSVNINGGAGTVVNDGSIAGTGTRGAGVRLYSGGSVVNGASASITGGANGIHISGGVGTALNDGSILGFVNGVLLDSGGSVSNVASAFITGGTDGVDMSEGGTLTNAGTIVGNTGTAAYLGGTGSNLLVLYPSYGFSGLAVGGLSASNTLELASAASAGTIADLGAEFINFGSIVVDPGADWTIDGGGSDPAGSVTVENDATLFIVNAPTFDGGSVYMESGSLINVSGASSVIFDYGDAATLVLDDPSTFTGSIGGFGFGDVIQLAGQTITSGSITGTTLTLDLAGGGTQMLNVAPGESGEKFTSTPSGGLVVACFCAGTRLLTLSGEVAVEALAPGDVVVTMSGRTRPVRWLGHRHLDCTRHPKPEDVWPVRVRTGAIGASIPHRDLLLSPDHAVFIDGVLIPIRHLINGRTIVQERVDEVAYYHVELPSHDVLLAEGLPCESYLDTGNRGAFANGGDAADGEGAAPTMLHPDFALKVWETKACAELVLDGPKLAAAKSVVLARAEALGHRLTSDPGLAVVVHGHALRPTIIGKTWCISLPPTARGVQLVSRTWVPAHTRAAEDDTRSLGVAIANVRLDGSVLPLDDPRFVSGWHAVEPAAGEAAAAEWRWTDGDAWLCVAGVRELAFDVVMTGSYWDATDLPKTKHDPASRGGIVAS
jgi:hypothetical protein